MALTRLIKAGCVPDGATADVLLFIAAHVQPEIHESPVAEQRGEDQLRRLLLPLSEFESHLAGHQIVLCLGDDITTRCTLWQLFQRFICSVKSLDVMSSLLTDIEPYFAVETGQDVGEDVQDAAAHHTPFSTCSPLGIFVRRVKVEFERLPFADVMQLWHDFQVYMITCPSSSQDILSEKGRSFTFPFESRPELNDGGHDGYGWASDMIHQAVESAPDSLARPTQHEVDRLLEFQIEQMQSMTTPNDMNIVDYSNEVTVLGGSLPLGMKKQVEKLLLDCPPPSSQVHYLRCEFSHAMRSRPFLTFDRYLEAWHQGDYTAALGNLQRYYDFAMQSRDKMNYQYALLTMSMLQADFGCYEEAVAAMNETIATARENKDNVCLHYALSLLQRLRSAVGRSLVHVDDTSARESADEGVLFLRAGARKDKLWTVEVSTLISEARSGIVEVSRYEADMAVC